MKIKELFFADKNINYLMSQFIELTNVKDKNEAIKLRDFLITEMKLVYSGNKNKIKLGDPKKILPKINEKSLNRSVNSYISYKRMNDKQKQIKKLNSNNDLDDMYASSSKFSSFMPQPKNGQNNQSRQKVVKQRENDFRGMYTNDDDYEANVFDQNMGGFISATGELMDEKLMNQQQASFNDKSKGKDELENLIMQRRSENDAFGNTKNRPQEINFCLDGGDTRASVQSNNNQQNQNNNDFNYEQDTGEGLDDGFDFFTGGLNDMFQTGPDMSHNNMGGQNNMTNMQTNHAITQDQTNIAKQMNDYHSMNDMLFNNQSNEQNNPFQERPAYQQIGTLQPQNPNMFNQFNNQFQSKKNSNIDERLALLESERKNINFVIPADDKNVSYTRSKIDELIESSRNKKKIIANKLGLDPEQLLLLKPRQIKDLLTCHSDNESQDNDSYESSENESYQSKKHYNSVNTKDGLIQKLQRQRQDNEKRHNKINQEYHHVIKNMEKKIESNTDGIIIKKKDENIKRIVINSADCAEPEFYNNYKFIMQDKIDNIQKINIRSVDFPILKPDVDDEHNTFTIKYKNELIPIELSPNDDYKLDDIIDGINESYKDENLPFKIKCVKNGLIVIENTKGENFDLDLTDRSMGLYLGFQKSSYRGKSKYISEYPHMFLEKSYFMFIKEISTDNAFCEILPDGNVRQLINDISINTKLRMNKTITELTFQYRESNNNQSELIDFYDEPHELIFEISTKNNTKQTY